MSKYSFQIETPETFSSFLPYVQKLYQTINLISDLKTFLLLFYSIFHL